MVLKDKLKIAVVIDKIVPISIGGSEIRYFEIYKRVPNNYIVFIIFTMGWEKNHSIRAIQRYWGNRENIIFVPIKIPFKTYNSEGRSIIGSVVFSIMVFFKLLLIKPHLVDANQPPQIHIIPLWVYAKLFRIPLIATCHEIWGIKWFSYYKGLSGYIIGMIGYWVELFLWRLPTVVIAVSKTTSENLSKLGVKPIIIENGINISLLRSLQVVKNNRSKPNFIKERKKKNFLIIYAGRLVPHKNVELLLRSVPYLLELHSKLNVPPIIVKIIGDGPQKRYLTRLAKKLKIEKVVQFIPFIEDTQEFYKCLKEADIIINLSEREGYGLIVAETLFFNKKPVLLDHVGKPPLWEYGILVPKKDPISVYKTIFDAIKNNKLNIHKKIQIKNWEDVSDEFWNLINNIFKNTL